jgi:hypothetical protein
MILASHIQTVKNGIITESYLVCIFPEQHTAIAVATIKMLQQQVNESRRCFGPVNPHWQEADASGLRDWATGTM